MYSIKNYTLVVMLLLSWSLHADSLPRVTGLNVTGDQLTWDAQEGASGYNIHLDYQYFDTVRGKLNYTLTEPGRYHVISFNDQGEFGVTRNIDESGQDFDLFSVAFENSASTVSYGGRNPVLMVYNTCKDVGPGETCIAHCPNNYDAPWASGIQYFRYLTGGACSTSDIVEADAFIAPTTYSCTVPTFSGEVVAQAICLMGN